MEPFAIGVRLFLGGVFLLAGLGKLPRRTAFEATVRAYDLLRPRFIRPVALLVPVAEALVGGLLLLGLLTTVAAAVVVAMLVIFSVAIAVNLQRGRTNLDCGCFADTHKIGWSLLARNAVACALAIFVAVVAPTAFGIDSIILGNSPVPTSEGVAVMIVSTLLGLLPLVYDATASVRDRINKMSGSETYV